METQETLYDLLVRRHSIRRYTDEPLSADDVKTILEAGLLAPSSKNARSWQFVLVDDHDTMLRLMDCKPAYAASLKNAPLAIVITSSPVQSEAYIEDASVAAAYMQLQATALGLGACWVQVRGRFSADGTPSEEVVRELLGIPDDMCVLCILTVGHPDEQRRPVDLSKLLWEKIHIGNWQSQD